MGEEALRLATLRGWAQELVAKGLPLRNALRDVCRGIMTAPPGT